MDQIKTTIWSERVFCVQTAGEEDDELQETVTEQRHTDETIMTDEEARKYTLANVFGSWHPDEVIKEVEKKAQKLMKRLK